MMKAEQNNPLLPQICEILAIKAETPRIKTFRVSVPAGEQPFAPVPGQMVMLSLPGVGEAAFSISAWGDNWLEFAIKRVGELTEALHEASAGQKLGLRGPYGNGFPLARMQGQHLLLIGGGIGVAPLRSLMRYALANREDYGGIDIVYGARCPEEVAFKQELGEDWPSMTDTRVHITVDSGAAGWAEQVGLLPDYVQKLAFSPQNRTAILCGPPPMLESCFTVLQKLGFAPEDVFASLEMRMVCGIGICGRCNIGGKYVCVDGPVFSRAELASLQNNTAML